MTVGYVAQCAVRGITLDSLEIETDGEIDLRGFLGIDPAVPAGYENLNYTVRVKGSGTKEQFAEIHEAVMGDWARYTTRLRRSARPSEHRDPHHRGGRASRLLPVAASSRATLSRWRAATASEPLRVHGGCDAGSWLSRSIAGTG